ncbi:MAG: IS4 family transposase [Pirellulaceae bacterium]|nr:IS4 family transposase [Pirellulaceae bacterium]
MLDPKELERRKAAEKEQDFSKARQLLVDLIALPDLQAVFDDEDCPDAKRVYTQAPTLALLVLQRLGGGLTLTAAVQELLQYHADLLPRNRRVEEGTLSQNNSAYNQARQKLPLQKVEAFSNAICNHLAAHSKPVWQGRRVMILDGSTLTLPPTAELKKAFPPATNQHGESVWPVAMLMVASELSTGSVLVPEVDAMYGENNSSEAEQAERVIDRLPLDALVLADSGFGIFRVAYHCDQCDKEFVFRLTVSRFKSLKKKATLVEDEKGFRTWYLRWQPSPKDRKSNPQLPKDATIEVFVHQIELEGEKNLYLVSNVEADAASLGELYLRRYDIEFDIRDLKVTMDTENLRAKKLDTVMKELLGSVIAYNLVAQFRRQAAELANVKPRRLSFSGVWLTFQHHLLFAPSQSFESWQATYAAALVSAANRKLPNRPSPRSSPRMAHPRRPKTTKFQKSLRKKKKQKPPD